jgi:hypothetical protein
VAQESKAYDDRFLRQCGYKLARAFDYSLPGAAAPLYQVVRYELAAGLEVTPQRPRKQLRVRRPDGNGGWLFGAGPRRIPYNFGAVIGAGPGMPVIVTEGEKNADDLIARGILATTALSHAWTPACAAALHGMEVMALADHDEMGQKYAEAARQAIGSYAASVRIVPAAHLWAHLTPEQRGNGPQAGDDVSDWLARGGDAARLVEICRTIPVNRLDAWNAGAPRQKPPPRGWLLGVLLCRKVATALLADGGVGKTALALVQMLELTTGRSLIGDFIHHRGRALYLSFEDDDDELKRRLEAAMMRYHIEPAEIDGRLFLKALRRQKLAVADDKGTIKLGDLGRDIIAMIRDRQLDCVVFDPFVKTHNVSENDNNLIDQVANLIIDIAIEENIAAYIPHHINKSGDADPGNANRGRGAVAFKDACRLVYTLTPMTAEEGRVYGLANDVSPFFIRLDRGKLNTAPPAQPVAWFRLIGLSIDNETADYPADNVHTVEQWHPPETIAGMTPETIAAVLAEIDRGKDGEFYSASPNAQQRAAWRVVVAYTRPPVEEATARAVIQRWVKDGLLYYPEEKYHSKLQNKKVFGLCVAWEKVPK